MAPASNRSDQALLAPPIVTRKKAFTRLIPENDISNLMKRMGDRTSEPNVKDQVIFG